MTAAEYMALPDDGCRYELIHAARVMSPSALHAHGRVCMYVAAQLDEFVIRRGLGVVRMETDVVLGGRDVRRSGRTGGRR